MSEFHSDWLIPKWPAPVGVHAVCTTRLGGVSKSPYDSLNVADHLGDDPTHVAANRAIFQQAIGAKPVFLKQVHGTRVLTVNATTPNACEADACMTEESGMACTVMVADCLPVLMCCSKGDWVAAIHAGWMGPAGQGGVGILEETYKAFCALKRMDQAQLATEIIAWLGPCIGPQAFEVEDNVRLAFITHHEEASEMFRLQQNGKWLCNLPGLARQRLAKLGITQVHGNDGSDQWCTVTQPSRFFSFRSKPVSGRIAVGIWIDR